jgi:hypothetical protein
MAVSASLTLAAMATFVATFCGCSSDSHVAGNSAETGSPELAGILLLEGGNPAAYARVQCVPQNFDAKAGDVLPTAFTTETNADGAYSLNSIPAGTYAIEAYHEKSGKRLLVQNVKVTEDDLLAVNDTLREPGIVKFEGVYDLEDGETGVATVLGTTIRRNIVVHGRTFVIDSLPAGTLDLRVFFDEELGEKLWMQGPIGVAPGDTETFLLVSPIPVEPDVKIPQDSVVLTFVAPLALPEGTDTLNSVVTDIPIAIRLTEKNCNFDSLKFADNGNWKAVRISKDGTRSRNLPISYDDFYRESKEMVVWVRVDSLNVDDSLEIVYDGLQTRLYAFDVFPTNRSYSLVWHFGYSVSPQTDYAEKRYFEGTAFGSVDSDAIDDGVVGLGVRLDSAGSFYVKKSAKVDSTRKVNMSFDDDGYFCFSLWLQLESLEMEQTIFEKAKEYALRYVPEKGFVVEFYHVADSSNAQDSASYKISWTSGMDGIKAGEWTYVSFSRRAFEESLFYVNDSMVSALPEQSDWDDTKVTFSLEPSDRSDSGDVRAYFEVGGFAGKLDELMIGGCYRDETWTRLTYLNQKPTDYWPTVQPRK